MNLDEVLAKVGALDPKSKAQLTKEVMKATEGMKFIPNPGPQTEAFFSLADLLGYGGQGGGGKSSLLNGLALTQHRRSLIVRRQYSDLLDLIDEMLKLHGSRKGFNGSPPAVLRTEDDRVVQYGGVKNPGDEESYRGRGRDLLGVDEAVQFTRRMIEFLMGWVRSPDPNQRCRTVLATNPPETAGGDWFIEMFRPWVDLTHPLYPFPPGQLRFYVTDPDGKDMEVEGPDPIELNGKVYIPKSRTFIFASLDDNPFLKDTGYRATLDALPEPLRSAVRDGNFQAMRQDRARQVIPTAWVTEAQNRWHAHPPVDVPMCAIGSDMAGGGDNDMVLAPRHDGWYAELVKIPGAEVRRGDEAASRIIQVRRDKANVIIDMGGGYGTAAKEHLENNGIEVTPFIGANATQLRSKDGQFGFYNVRSAAYWLFREALDPSQPGGSAIALPDSPRLVADLTAPEFTITSRGIQITPKEKVIEILGRSPDEGDAVVMAWWAGMKHITAQTIYDLMRPDQRIGGTSGRRPNVDLGRGTSRRRH